MGLSQPDGLKEARGVEISVLQGAVWAYACLGYTAMAVFGSRCCAFRWCDARLVGQKTYFWPIRLLWRVSDLAVAPPRGGSEAGETGERSNLLWG